MRKMWRSGLPNQDLASRLRFKNPSESAESHLVGAMPVYPYIGDEQRRVARVANESWNGVRYLVAWQYAGKEVWVRDYEPALRSTTAPRAIAIYREGKQERFDKSLPLRDLQWSRLGITWARATHTFCSWLEMAGTTTIRSSKIAGCRRNHLTQHAPAFQGKK